MFIQLTCVIFQKEVFGHNMPSSVAVNSQCLNIIEMTRLQSNIPGEAHPAP